LPHNHQPLHLIRSVQDLLPNLLGASLSLSCLPLVNRLGCPSSTPGKGIPFLDCLLLFSRLSCPGITPGRDIPFPDYLLLFNPLHCTQSPGTVTHLSHTRYVCEAPPDNPLLLLLLASCTTTYCAFLRREKQKTGRVCEAKTTCHICNVTHIATCGSPTIANI
jgi:hypothetical protein